MTTEISEPPESQALQTIPQSQLPVDSPRVREITPQEARNESIAHTLDAAYARASMLQLTPEEAKALMADFDDSDIRTGARGDDSLIYLEHAAVRRRLMEVFGPGQWTIINRRSWLDEAGGWLYADIVLICRGCFVGECIGAARYSAQNKRTNYADAVKGAESDALGRIAGTALGVGLQLWSKGFADGWHQRNRGNRPQAPQTNQRAYTMQPERTYQKPAPQANVERPATTPAAVLPAKATEKTREWAWNSLITQFDVNDVWNYLVGKKWVDGGTDGTYDQWPLEHVPTSKQALAVLADEIRKTLPTNTAPNSQLPVDSDGLPPEWADVIFSIAPKGMKKQEWLDKKVTIGQMYRGTAEDKKRLFGYAKGDWRPEDWIDNQGKKRPPSQEDVACRVALDLFLDWREQRGETE